MTEIESAQRILITAEQGLELARMRKEFAVGIVLETLRAEEDLTRARHDHFRAVADFNAAQYELSAALGAL